jgi:nucleoside-diphosphate-sugar epimerase
MNKIKIAITGADGFVGRHLVNFFSNKNFEVIELSRTTNPQSSYQHQYYYLGKKKLKLAGIDVLIHCAYDFSLADYIDIQRVNVQGSLNLFKQAKEAGVNKIIHLSSMSAFDSAVSHYGKAKYAIEEASKLFGVIQVRPGLIFSAQNHGLIGALERLVKNFKILPLVGFGKQFFYPCHINDLANLLLHLLINSECNDVITAASEEKINLKQLLELLALLRNKKVFFIPVPLALIYSGLKLSELFKFNIKFRSDSLTSIKFCNHNIDFSPIKKLNIKFRALNHKSLQEKN